jgi:hypothetical protein
MVLVNTWIVLEIVLESTNDTDDNDASSELAFKTTPVLESTVPLPLVTVTLINTF